jgi:DNA polymerase-3 subunit delta'
MTRATPRATAVAAPPAVPLGPAGWPVWGHDAAVAGLRRAVARDRVAHAYLIAGPAGVGKTALATAFAQALCCQAAARPAVDVGCGVCLACRKIARGVHPDVQTFDLASQVALADKSGGKNTTLTIETVRRLSAATALRPLEARRRVIVVDDAETMQGVAQEALLKTLEEPPAAVVLLVLADDAESLLPTIQSRCRLVELRPVAPATVVALLTASGLATARADEIAGLAAGCPGWALRAAADPALVTERRAAVDRALAWLGGSTYDRLVAAVRLGDGFGQRRDETFADFETLLGIWRDALLLRVGLDHRLTHRGDLERLETLAREWDLAAIQRAIAAVRTCIADLEANVRPRLAMEAMVLQWPTPSRRQ